MYWTPVGTIWSIGAVPSRRGGCSKKGWPFSVGNGRLLFFVVSHGPQPEGEHKPNSLSRKMQQGCPTSSPSALAWHEEIIDNREDEQCQQKPVEYRFPFALEKLVCVHFPFASASGVKMSYEPPTGLTVRRLRGFLKRKIRDWMAPMERFIV